MIRAFVDYSLRNKLLVLIVGTLLLGWGAFLLASLVAILQSVRYLFPNATYEQPTAFKAGPPSEYAVGSTTVMIDKRVVINRDPNGFYAFNLICTHLGCTPRWFTDVTSDLVAKGITSIKDPGTGQAASPHRPERARGRRASQTPSRRSRAASKLCHAGSCALMAP